jgi:hypothetical protein
VPDTRKGETIDQLEARVDAAIDHLTRLRPEIAVLWHRGQHEPADPYPASVRPADTPGGTNTATPTERAALREHQPTDPIGHLIEDIFWGLREVDRLALGIEGRRQLIHRALTKNYGRVDTTGTCEACKRTVPGTPEDRLRSGYCQKCHRQWLREGRPDRVAFEQRRLDDTRQDQAS